MEASEAIQISYIYSQLRSYNSNQDRSLRASQILILVQLAHNFQNLMTTRQIKIRTKSLRDLKM